MKYTDSETVLLICSEEAKSRKLLSSLFDAGLNVVGPADTAELGLALAAQTIPTMALVANRPTGRRNAEHFARDLMETWGISTLILPEAAGRRGHAVAQDPWTASPVQQSRLLEALELA